MSSPSQQRSRAWYVAFHLYACEHVIWLRSSTGCSAFAFQLFQIYHFLLIFSISRF
jgi:hypothetical protein